MLSVVLKKTEIENQVGKLILKIKITSKIKTQTST